MTTRAAPRTVLDAGTEACAFSVIVLASRDAAAIRTCLRAVARSAGDRAVEILVVLHGAGGDVEAELESLRPFLPGLRALRASPGTLGAARNLALRRARGEVAVFLDDDAAPKPGFFAAVERKLAEHPEADVLGGPNLTFPDSPFLERIIGLVLASPFGAGTMSLRYGGMRRDAWTDERALMLCNLCVRLGALRGEGLEFDEDVTRNEENLLLERLRLRGRRMLHSPELSVYHRRRATGAAFWRQCFLSGIGRVQMTRKLPESLRAEHLAPAAMGLALAAWALGAPLGPALALYGGGVVAASAVAALRAGEGPAAFLVLLALFPLGHLGYAAGMARGLLAPARRAG